MVPPSAACAVALVADVVSSMVVVDNMRAPVPASLATSRRVNFVALASSLATTSRSRVRDCGPVFRRNLVYEMPVSHLPAATEPLIPRSKPLENRAVMLGKRFTLAVKENRLRETSSVETSRGIHFLPDQG